MKVKKQEVYYYIICIYTIYCVFGSSFLTDIFLFKEIVALMRYIVLIFAFFGALCNIARKYTPKLLLLVTLWFAVFIVCYYNTRYMEIVWFALLVLYSAHKDYNRVINITLNVTIVCVGFVVLCSAIGLIDSNTVITSTGLIRHACGFRHVNYLGGLILKCFSCYIYKNFSKWSIWDSCIGVVLCALCYFYIVTRTCAFSLLFSMVVILLIKVLDRFSGVIRMPLLYGLIYSVVGLAIMGSIVVSINYPRISNAVVLDQLFSNRISSAYRYYTRYGISLLGQQIALTSTLDAAEFNVQAFVLDNSYMHLLIHCGSVVFLLVIVMYLVLIRNAIIDKHYAMITILLIYILCSASEKWLFMPQYNICCFIIPSIFSYHNQGEGTERLNDS